MLVRNPHFREWSAAAQPNGYPDRIVVTYGSALGKQLTAIEHGKADFMESPLPASRVHEIETRYAAQVHVFPDVADLLGLPQHETAAVQQARGATGVQLRDRPQQGHSRVRRSQGGRRHLPDHPGRHGGLPTLLSLHAQPDSTTESGRVPTSPRPSSSSTRREPGDRRWSSGPATLPLGRVTGKLALATLKELGYRASLKILEHDYWDVR